MKSNLLTLESDDIPEVLRTIPAAPKKLYYQGPLLDLLESPRLSVVGSRKVSPYGRFVTQKLAGGAAGQGLTIVSGLAFGVDALAHQAALDAGGRTIAVLPSSLTQIYPASHRGLAQRILDNGGALVSEYEATPSVRREYFIARNRLISGLSQATLITEAALKSGSLHTARFALEQGRTVLAFPGNINSETSVGTNNLIKAGAVPVTEVDDIFFAMELEAQPQVRILTGSNDAETTLLQLLSTGAQDGDTLLAESRLAVGDYSQALTMLEITGRVRSLGANQWTLA
jgi:DNA processing protein